MQRKLTNYLREEVRIDKEVLKKLRRLADRYSIQYALLWYIYLKSGTGLRELYNAYRYLSGKTIRENTVRKQLQQLERKGLIRREGGRYFCLVDPREVHDLFDIERSKAGRIGATLRHMKLTTKSLKISPGLAYYVKKVVEESQKPIRRGKRAVALDLIAHTLLPLRENEVLWLWHQDIFVYYIKKSKAGEFRAIKSKEISDLLKKPGFSEGIMILHVLGHKEASVDISFPDPRRLVEEITELAWSDPYITFGVITMTMAVLAAIAAITARKE